MHMEAIWTGDKTFHTISAFGKVPIHVRFTLYNGIFHDILINKSRIMNAMKSRLGKQIQRAKQKFYLSLLLW